MQIQRIQTLWLLAALGCMVAFIVMPFGSLEIPGEGVAALKPFDFMGLLIPAGLAALIQLVAIFSYKTPSNQRSEAVLGILMALVAVGITVYILCDRATLGTIHWGWSSVFALASLVFNVLALMGINHDIKLLRSYDRLR